jgi:molybdopterin-containing oxidoreductase family membrane subunit
MSAHGVTTVPVAAAPLELEREPLVANRRSVGWISDQIAAVAEGKTPWWWWAAFVPSVCLLVTCFSLIAYLVSAGTGVWGLSHPVMWGWAIINFVWWIGIGPRRHAHSAILFLLRQKWRTGVNRAAEAMTIFAVMCAGIYPLIHVGRVWLGWWLVPDSLFAGNLAAVRSPLMWGRVCGLDLFHGLACVLVHGTDPDSGVMRDRAKTKIRKFA